MVEPDPLVRPETLVDDTPERALRPERLDDFTGQAEARANLQVFIEAARRRSEAMDHLLFHGPPGLGKTTLAQIVSRELGVNFRMTSGPVIAKPGDLAAVLTNLEPRDVLFIDEIHRLSPVVEEILYPAMEDFELDIVLGKGPAARSIRLEIPPFTLVGATTRIGLCKGTKKSCLANPDIYLEFEEDSQTSKPGRTIFRSVDSLDGTIGGSFTILAFKGDQPAHAQEIKFQKK